MARKRPPRPQPQIDFDAGPPAPFADRVNRPPPASSHADRVRRSRTLFDDLPDDPDEAVPGTVIRPPDAARGNGDPTPLPPCPAAPLPAAADSPPCRPAPIPGSANEGDPMQHCLELPAGEKAKARDILAAVRTLKAVEGEHRPATPDEQLTLARFGGFGPVALHVFPDPVTGQYKDGWRDTGEELKALLTDDEYASAKRTTFNAFYTSPAVVSAMHQALTRLGVSPNATVLEPGCATGRFIRPGFRFIGVEMDSLSGRIARLLHPAADIRVENFRDTKLPQLDAVIGNVPFADVKLDHRGQRFSLHDYFFAKSVDALKPGGVLALVTSHFTLDKQNASVREYLGDRADFLGAIRLPSDAFKREGTAVVTDIVFLRKRAPGEPERPADDDWKQVAPLEIVGGSFVSVNRYFLNHPEMVLGAWSRRDTLYGEGYGVTSSRRPRRAVEGGGRAAAAVRAVARDVCPECESPADQRVRGSTRTRTRHTK